ncbi:heterokaryon incompatibility protein-domain-containing protein [Biscogniauxia mediterranea]|nr:heterokaryon incompatibility protein-domain-containing protein [Biscogniauxia mediterranea]
MICDFCRMTVLESGKTWGFHRSDDAALQVSAQDGCVFCVKLHPHVLKTTSEMERSALQDRAGQTRAWYWWSIRRSAKIRETRQHVVIAFRPVDSSTALPDITFYLLPEEEEEGHSGAHGIPRSQLGGRTDSRSSWVQIRKWVNDCDAHHVKCARTSKSNDFMPTRVLDVGHFNSSWPPQRVRVVDTQAEQVYSPYMTLSHSWGKDKSFAELKQGNLDEYRVRGVPWSEICRNKNLEHAVRVARRLGIRYLWMDSLCIIQDEADKKDWHAEAPLMHLVYRNSYCNIAAADSGDCNGGLFRDREEHLDLIVPSRYVPSEGDKTLFQNHKWQIVSGELWRGDLLQSVLYSRGWIFQERMLSQRILHFSSTQIFWDCSTISACEVFPAGLPQPLDTGATDRHWRERLRGSETAVLPLVVSANDSLETFWKTAVRTYTSCDLTYHSDKLAAIWGIAKQVRDALGEEYFAGLWQQSLLEQLAWRVVDCRKSKRYEDKEGGFPSWSWSSIGGAMIEVADRRPTSDYFYEATNHNGTSISIEVESPIYHAQAVDTLPDWKQELVNMTMKLDKVALERQPEKAINSLKTTHTRRPKHLRDLPPVLKHSDIEIQGFIGHARLQKIDEDGEWALSIEGIGHEEVDIRAFPDTQPLESRTPCQFLVLAASREYPQHLSNYVDTENEDLLEEQELEVDAIYSGFGILVEDMGKDRFRRRGAMNFRTIDKKSWEYILRSAQQRQDSATEELDASQCPKIWLY